MYHPSWPLGAQCFLIVELIWTINFVTGGEKDLHLNRTGYGVVHVIRGWDLFWMAEECSVWQWIGAIDGTTNGGGNICVLTPFRKWCGSRRSVSLSLRRSVGAGVVAPAEKFHSPPPYIISTPWITRCLIHASLVSVPCCISISSLSDKRSWCAGLLLILLVLQGCFWTLSHKLSWCTCSRNWMW